MEGKTLGSAIRQAREQKGFSQEKLAEQVEVSRQAVSKWEMGLAVPTGENLKRLEEALGLTDGALREVCDTQDAPQDDRKSFSPKRAAALAAAAALMVGIGFFAGRATAPAPTPEEPETKIIWRMTASHIDHPNPYESEERNTYDEMGRLLKRENLGSPADPTVRVNEFVYDEDGNQTEQRTYNDGKLIGSYMCQGKMPMPVRARYEAMAAQDPAKFQPMLDNFDRALAHPDQNDLDGMAAAVKAVL